MLKNFCHSVACKHFAPAQKLLISCLLIAGCLASLPLWAQSNLRANPKANPKPLLLGTEPSSAGTLEIYELVHSLRHPWSVSWLPSSAILGKEGQQGKAETNAQEQKSQSNNYDVVILSERNGAVWLLWQMQLYKVEKLPQDVVQQKQGGYLGLYYSSGRVYLSYSKKKPGNKSTLALISFRLQRSKTAFAVTDLRLEFEVQSYLSGNLHYGGSIAADSDSLYLSLGERHSRHEAQNPRSDWGSIVRLTKKPMTSASASASASAMTASSVSIGHRNPQGLAYDAEHQQLWSTEHGPQGGDELNLIEFGKNYGWPVITYGVEYGSAAKIGEGTHKAGLEQPVRYWVPSPAPGGLAIISAKAHTGYSPSLLPQWRGDLLIPMLKGQKLLRLRLDPSERLSQNQAQAKRSQKNRVEEELFVRRFGRLRWVGQGPDGAIYLLTDHSSGKFLRIAPQQKAQ